MPRPVLGKLLVASAPLVLAVACLSSNPGQEEASEPASGGPSSSEASAESTLGGIMTTTEEPESEDSGAAASTGDEGSTEGSGESTVMIPATCGDKIVDPGEECDNGAANANDAACTLACKEARCGDGYVQMNEEACDDGVNDGTYGGCNEDCMSLASHCGDLVVDEIAGEACDDDSPELGCLKNCSRGESCKQLQDSWADAATSGLYKIFPKQNKDVDAYCDMTTDEGGYTFVKFGGNQSLTAAEAEAKCGEIGLHLLIPRTAPHLAASYAVAADLDLEPLGGVVPPKAAGYLKIFGIYPVTAGESCVDQALNKEACPQWRAADDDAFWISDASLAMGQPGTNNCAGCSMAYYWEGDALTSYEVIYGNGTGADSQYFLCDAGDKFGMN